MARHPQFPDAAAAIGLEARIPTALRTYFGSCWAFFLPYLALYLVYAALNWPTNPGHPVREENIAFSASYPPSLIHLYWTLHIAHAILAVIALVGLSPNWKQALSSLWSVTPWLAIALVLLTAGPYIEFPSDAWEHLRRANDWKYFGYVADNPEWHKAPYFLLYSFTQIPFLSQLSAIWIYSALMGFLLLRSYFLLGRQAGLNDSWAIIFTAVQLALLGNSCFSFVRYYALANSMVSQIAALAAIRAMLHVYCEMPHGTLGFARFTVLLMRSLVLPLAVACMSHLQGLILVGTALSGVIFTYLAGLNLHRKLAVLLVSIIAGVGFVVLVQSPTLENLVARAWLTPTYSFNIFNYTSPAFGAIVSTLGLGGVLTLICGALLVKRNHVIGWISLAPLLLLLYPLSSASLCALVLYHSSELQSPVAIYRIFYALPFGLSCVIVLQSRSNPRQVFAHLACPLFGTRRRQAMSFGAVAVVGLLICVLLPPDSPSHIRLWHSIARIPTDICFIDDLKHGPTTSSGIKYSDFDYIFANPSQSFVMLAMGDRNVWAANRLLASRPTFYPSTAAESQLNGFERSLRSDLTVLSVATERQRHASQAALLSGHWLPYEVALSNAGAKEIAAGTKYKSSEKSERASP